MILAKDGIHSYEKIREDTYRIDEKGIANTYLLLGKDKALLIDSGLGVGDLYQTIRELTELPIVLALTHRHCDHAGGRNYFKEYYVNENDKPLIYKILSSQFASKKLLSMNKENKNPVKFNKQPNHAKPVFIKDGYSFDLGGRIVKTINTPGHTKGSIVFLDEKTKLMFTGDDVNLWLWLQLPGCTNLSTWLIGAKKILGLAEEYTPYCGHNEGLITKEGIRELIRVGEELLVNKTTNKAKTFNYPEDEKAPARICITKSRLK
ncbi:MAG: MBL fold metallo-hydrolase [Bacilli bacterium]|jgi:glyoxylase-like metal-dependent hydrolase (beta-lactamase superfamily II)|nr:MBL fold metallo-hydrolase [Bacilli bacterium]